MTADDARDAARYRRIRTGKSLTVRVPVKDKRIIYYLADKPEAGFGDALDAAIDAEIGARDANGVTLDRRDLFDYARAAIQDALDVTPFTGYVEGWQFQEATTRTEALFKRLFGDKA